MSRETILKCWLLLCCVTVSRQLSITEFEVPASVKAGEDVELKCRFELGKESQERLVVKWWSIPLHGDNRKALYQRIVGEQPSKLPHVELGSLDTIVLKNVTPLDSGTYECEVSNVDEVRRHQDLVVFTPGSGPQLNVSLVEEPVDAEEVRIECQASDVAPAPDLVVKVNGKEATLTKVVSGPDARGLYSVLGNATAALYEAEGAALSCDLLYESAALAHPPYTDTFYYVSGPASTDVPEDATEVDATTDSQLAGTGQGSWQARARWLLVVTTPALAAALR